MGPVTDRCGVLLLGEEVIGVCTEHAGHGSPRTVAGVLG
jgi:hypothetical protein